VIYRSRDTWSDKRWRAGDELGQPAKVLRDRCQRELELSAARPTQSQTPKPQNALEMSKQHLNALSVTPRSFECLSLGQLASNVASLLVDAARHPAERRLRATLRLEQTAATVAHAGHVKKCLTMVDQRARRPQGLACWADVYVALNLKASRLKVPSSRFDLSITGMCGAIFFSYEPVEKAVSAASRSGLISKRSSVRSIMAFTRGCKRCRGGCVRWLGGLREVGIARVQVNLSG
jgi:hypothetical protein